MKVISKAFRFILVFMIICGLTYLVFITGVSQLLFKEKANGSIIKVNGKRYSNVLLAQEFTGDEYLWGRIMSLDTSAFTNEDGEILMYAAPSNLDPAGEEYEKLVSERIEKIKASNPGKKGKPISVDLVASSGGGPDPYISAIAAEYQVERIVKARNISTDEIEQIIGRYTRGRIFEVFGEEIINVLQVSLALDGKLWQWGIGNYPLSIIN